MIVFLEEVVMRKICKKVFFTRIGLIKCSVIEYMEEIF